MLKRLNKQGDTIIEVMIALAMITFIITIAYGTANRSLKQSRQSEERVEAAKILESQMEQIKAFSSNDTTYSSSLPAQPFCYTAANALQTVDSPAGNCTYGLYTVKTTYNASLHQYDVIVVWDSLVGSNQDQAEMHYRVY